MHDSRSETTTLGGGEESRRCETNEGIRTQVLSVQINELDGTVLGFANINIAAAEIKSGSPVAFPTETVYGLGADATSSQAVQAIYAAKQRPADNPLIVHFASTDQLRRLLDPDWSEYSLYDPIPKIYHDLIERFWPGPLSIILPLPEPSPLAPEVTNSLKTFGARMPSSPIALALIKTANLPLAAPSANASGKPSPTTASHVLEDMAGRIHVILDGGPSNFGVESTVVDGLCDPPCVLRPGGIATEELRQCAGWANVMNAYSGSEEHREVPNGVTDTLTRSNRALATSSATPNSTVHKEDSQPEVNDSLPCSTMSSRGSHGDTPRAPGMKYRHYSPKAHVVLVDANAWFRLEQLVIQAYKDGSDKVGIIRTTSSSSPYTASNVPIPEPRWVAAEILDIGPTTRQVAHGLFAALRELDARAVNIIFVEGLPANDEGGEAVMNRLRKAAASRVTA